MKFHAIFRTKYSVGFNTTTYVSFLLSDDWVPPFDFRDGIQIRTAEKFNDYYELYEEIGEGKFGKVYRCIEKATGLTLAGIQ